MDPVLKGIGPRLRGARQRQDLTITEVAKLAGMSTSTLSRLESGQRAPNLELLLPVTRVLGITLDELIPPAQTDPRVRHRAKKVGRSTIVALSPDNSPVQTYRMTIHAEPGTPRLKTHDGREWFYVLSGQVKLILGERELIMNPGEAADFDTQVPHWIGPHGDGPIEVLSIFSKEGERIHTHGEEQA